MVKTRELKRLAGVVTGAILAVQCKASDRTVGVSSTSIPSVSPTLLPVERDISLLQLIATPQNFDGMFVRTCGYVQYWGEVRLQGEIAKIYISEEQMRHGMALSEGVVVSQSACSHTVTRAVAVPWTNLTPEQIKKISGDYYCLTGAYYAGRYSWGAPAPGVLCDIKTAKLATRFAKPSGSANP